jgi:hypothetical protein
MSHLSLTVALSGFNMHLVPGTPEQAEKRGMMVKGEENEGCRSTKTGFITGKGNTSPGGRGARSKD